MKLLDLFCGAGGAAMGYYYAGFDEIVGVDILPQPNYPFDFFQADALQIEFGKFDAVHASPPCQRWSVASGRPSHERTQHYTDSLRPIRAKLVSEGIPYVIENVEGAPLRNPIKLCGTLFKELRVLRHRLFECNFSIPQPKLDCANHPLLSESDYVTVAGGGMVPLAIGQKAMGINWMTQRELSEAIPPAYTQYIGKFLRVAKLIGQE